MRQGVARTLYQHSQYCLHPVIFMEEKLIYLPSEQLRVSSVSSFDCVENVVRNTFCVRNCTTRNLSKFDLLNQLYTLLHTVPQRVTDNKLFAILFYHYISETLNILSSVSGLIFVVKNKQKVSSLRAKSGHGSKVASPNQE